MPRFFTGDDQGTIKSLRFSGNEEPELKVLNTGKDLGAVQGLSIYDNLVNSLFIAMVSWSLTENSLLQHTLMEPSQHSR